MSRILWNHWTWLEGFDLNSRYFSSTRLNFVWFRAIWAVHLQRSRSVCNNLGRSTFVDSRTKSVCTNLCSPSQKRLPFLSVPQSYCVAWARLSWICLWSEKLIQALSHLLLYLSLCTFLFLKKYLRVGSDLLILYLWAADFIWHF